MGQSLITLTSRVKLLVNGNDAYTFVALKRIAMRIYDVGSPLSIPVMVWATKQPQPVPGHMPFVF
jgi:hypothetical protein